MLSFARKNIILKIIYSEKIINQDTYLAKDQCTYETDLKNVISLIEQDLRLKFLPQKVCNFLQY